MAVDAKNINRVDLNDIYKSVQRQSYIALRGLNRGGQEFSIDDFAITESEYDTLHEFSMEAMAMIANETNRIKFHTQTGIDALSNYQDLEDPKNAASYNDPDSETAEDETVEDPDGNTILVKDISGHQFTSGEKLPTGIMDTITFELTDWPVQSDGDNTKSHNRYTVVQQFIKNCIEYYILCKWWKLHTLFELANSNEVQYMKIVGELRANITSFHNQSTTRLPQKPMWGF